jgi:ribosomal protein L7Ae-like RNA K-turn-binding protein
MDNIPVDTAEKAAGRLTGMIGLARRAGRLTFGFDAVAQDIEAHKAKAVLISNDASIRTADKVKDICGRYGARFVILPVSKALLGRSIGRDDIAVVAIGDKSFADRILDLACAGAQSAPAGQTDSGGN